MIEMMLQSGSVSGTGRLSRNFPERAFFMRAKGKE